MTVVLAQRSIVRLPTYSHSSVATLLVPSPHLSPHLPPYIGNPLYVIGYCDLMLESNLGGVVPILPSRSSLNLGELPTNTAAQTSNSDREYSAQLSPGFNLLVNEGQDRVKGPQYTEGKNDSIAISDEGGIVATGSESVTASAGQASEITAAMPERPERVEGLPGNLTSKEKGEQLPKSPNRTIFRYEAFVHQMRENINTTYTHGRHIYTCSHTWKYNHNVQSQAYL